MQAYLTSLAQITSSFWTLSIMRFLGYQELQFKQSLQCSEIHDVLKSNAVLLPGVNLYSSVSNMSCDSY